MGQNRNLPVYDKSEAIEISPIQDVQSSASSLISAFQQFSNAAASVERLGIKYETDYQRQIIRNQVAKDFSDFSQQAMSLYADKNQSLHYYDQQVGEYSKRYLDNTSFIFRNYSRNVLDYFSNAHRQPILSNAIKQNQRIEQSSRFQRVGQDTNKWQDAIASSKPMVDKNGKDIQFEAATSFFAQQIASLQDDAIQGFITPATYEKSKEKLKEQFVSEVYLKKYEDHVKAGKGSEFLSDLANPNTHIADFNGVQKSRLLGRLLKIQHQQQQANALALGNLKDLEQNEIAHVEDGAVPDVTLQEKIKDANPKNYESFVKRVDVAQHVYDIKQAAIYQTPNAVREKLDALLPKKDDPNYGQMKAIHDAAVIGINKFYKDYRNDPMKYIMKDPTINGMINNYYQANNANALGKRLPGSPLNDPIPMPWNRIIQLQLNSGLTLTTDKKNQAVKLLSPEEANSRVAAYNTATDMKKIDLLTKWNDEFGGGAPFNIVMQQLINKGLPKQAALLTYIDPKSPDAHDVITAFSSQPAELHKVIGEDSYSAIKDAVNAHVNENDGTPNFQSFMHSVTNNGGNNIDFYKNMTNAVMQLAMFYKASNHSLSEDDAITKAENVVSSRWQYPLINGNPVPVPHQYTPDAVVSYANSMKKKVSGFPFVLSKNNPKIARLLINRGHWVNDGVDHGLIWADENGAIWRDKNGAPFGFSFDEAEANVRPN